MQGGVIGGICLLAFLLSAGRAEELERVKELDDPRDVKDTKEIKEREDSKEPAELETPDDLKSELSLVVTQPTPQDDEERSGAMAHSSSHSFGGSSISKAVAHSHGGGSSSAYSDGFGSSQSQAIAEAGVQSQASLMDPFSPEMSPYISPSSGLSQAEAQAISNSGSAYGQGKNSYPYSSSYPFSTGSSSAQAQAQSDDGFYQSPSRPLTNFNSYNPESSSAQASNGFYQPKPILTPITSSEISSAQAQAQANNGLYEPGLIPAPILTPFSQGSSSAQAQANIDSGSYQTIIDPLSVQTKPIPRYNPESNSAFPSSYPYNLGSSSAQAQAQSQSDVYQPIPIPDRNPSPYDPFLIPYKGSSSAQAQAESDAYQPIPIPNPNPLPYESSMVPYKGSNSAQVQIDSEPYQPKPFPKPNPKQYDYYPRPYNDGLNAASAFSLSNGLKYNFAQAEAEGRPYQPLPIPDPYESSLVQYRGPNSAQPQAQIDTESYQPIAMPYDTKSYPPFSASYPYSPVIRSGGNNLDESDLNTVQGSKSGWDPYSYNPYPPTGPNPQFYPPAPEAAHAYSDGKPISNPNRFEYSQGISPYVNDYPSESPYRPGGFALAEQQLSSNAYASGESSPIAFQDAKSRIILPHEYVFPNKMPGGENVIQCSKENEFHHFWSQEVDCLVCICVNEYGLLTPVCASCGGCQNPIVKPSEVTPRLPEPVPVRPSSPEPFEPIPIVPEPYPLFPQLELKPEQFEPVPRPEPVPEPYGPIPQPQPVPEPYGPVPKPMPYPPPYPEPIPVPSPAPESFSELIPTLPPLPSEATCNPLPSGQPFTNPLHPCQICICKESYTAGKPDVQIQCKENPQCITPADVTTLPPIPDVPMPVPLPMCEKFPEHVLFPHPTDACKLCKCSKSLSEVGIPEQLITCYPHPDCVPKLDPITEPANLVPPSLPIPIEPYQLKPYPEPEPIPIPVEPLREPFQPMEPVPLPEIVTVEPLPWPPITTIAPVSVPVTTPSVILRGPLPGPSPHESCQPYPPNQPFQHPWDECQICLCTEAVAIGMITVEVNCYTKPSCCIEPPDSVKLGYSNPYSSIGNTVNGPEIQVSPNGPQPGVIITSTYRPPSIYSTYSPRPINIYSGSGQPSSDAVAPSQGYLPTVFTRQSEDPYANPTSYPYQPNYHQGYVNPQYPDYPTRLPTPSGQYKPSNYGYPGNYQYNPGEAYPGSQGNYQYDPRYQGMTAPAVYSSMYQRPNYEMYPPGQIRDSYAQAQASAQGQSGSNAKSSAQILLQSKTGDDGPEDTDEMQ